MTTWLITALAALGALLLAMVKAASRTPRSAGGWPAKLIYRAALRLPRGERARWRKESMRDVLYLPGRLPPLLWALDVYVKSGRWGRARGAPSRWQALVARLRVVWQRLRALPTARARARAQQLHPASIQAHAQPAQMTVVASGAQVVASGVTRSGGSANLKPLREVHEMWIGQYRDGMMHLSDQEFVVWLSRQRQAFEDDVDQQVAKWRQTKAYRQAEAACRQAEAWRRRAETGGTGRTPSEG